MRGGLGRLLFRYRRGGERFRQRSICRRWGALSTIAQENLSSFGELPRNPPYRWRSFVVFLRKSCLVHSSFYYCSDRNALQVSPGGPLQVQFTRKLLRSIASRQAVRALFHPRSDVTQSRLESIRYFFFFSLLNPVVSVLFLGGSGLFIA